MPIAFHATAAAAVFASSTCFATAAAAPPVEGSVTFGAQKLAMTHAVAQLHDNAEGVLKRPLRIVVADRPIPPGALEGIGEVPAIQLALDGKLRGLLIRIDPARPYEASVIVLDAPREIHRSLGRLDVGTAQAPAVTSLKVAGGRAALVLGRPASPQGPAPAASTPPAPDVTFALRLDLPLASEPAVTADLRGDAVRAAPHYRAALAYLDAITRGDSAARRRASSRDLDRRTEQKATVAAPEKITEALRDAAPSMKAQLARVHRIVERGSRAALLIDDRAWITMVKEGGEWRSGD